MPIYHIYAFDLRLLRLQGYAEALARLHAETFHIDPLAVRVMFSTTASPNVNRAYVFVLSFPHSVLKNILYIVMLTTFTGGIWLFSC
jgi:hypothetical protein